MIRATNLVAKAAPVRVGPLTLRLGPGAYALIGRPADGVALLLSTFAGRTRASSGKAEALGGSPISANSRRGIGYVAIDAPLPEALRVDQALDLASRFRGEPIVPAAARLAKLGVEALVRRRVSSLRLEERRAVAVAEALTSTKTQLLLIDEPFMSMDGRAAANLARLLRLRAASGTCVVIATASTRDPLLIADEAFAFDRGSLVWRGNPSDRVALARGGSVSVRVTATDIRALASTLARDERASRVTLEPGALVAYGETLVDICAAIATSARTAHTDITSIVPDAAPIDNLFASIAEAQRTANDRAQAAAPPLPPPPTSGPVLSQTRSP
jgi:ABC-type multidrug transport system ATPase subunit